MRKVHVVIALALAATTPACSVIMIGSSAGGVAIHNSGADEKDRWGYGAPVGVAAGFGLIIDYFLWDTLRKPWSKWS